VWEVAVAGTAVAIVFVLVFTYMVDRGGHSRGTQEASRLVARTRERSARAFEAVRGRWHRIAVRERNRLSNSSD